jgi:hypothetical protein
VLLLGTQGGNAQKEEAAMLTRKELDWVERVRREGVRKGAELLRLRALRRKASARQAAAIDRVLAREAAGDDEVEALS